MIVRVSVVLKSITLSLLGSPPFRFQMNKDTPWTEKILRMRGDLKKGV